MPPTVTRELAITYGGFAVGGTTAYLVDAKQGQIEIAKQGDRARVSFHVFCQATTETAFAAACVALEDAFRKPYGDLVVLQGASTLASLKQSDDTALEMAASIEKVESPKNTGRSRLYRATLECGLPANNVTDAGLRDFSVSVAYSAARRRTATFSGTYTAAGGTKARAKYEASIDAKCQAALTAFGGAWKLAAEDPTATSYHDQTIRFARVYHQSVFDQGGGGLSGNADLREQQLVISRRRWSTWNSASTSIGTALGNGTGNSIGGGGPAQPLVELDATYEASFDVASGTSLSARWEQLESWIVGQMQSLLGGGSFALTDSRPTFHFDDNRISASLRGVGVDRGAGHVLNRKVVTTTDIDSGKVFDPVWTGNATDVFEFDGPKVSMRTTVLSIETLGGIDEANLPSQDGIPVSNPGLGTAPAGTNPDDGREPAAPPPPGVAARQTGGASGWVVIHTTDAIGDSEIGINGTKIATTIRTFTRVERFRTTPRITSVFLAPGATFSAFTATQ